MGDEGRSTHLPPLSGYRGVLIYWLGSLGAFHTIGFACPSSMGLAATSVHTLDPLEVATRTQRPGWSCIASSSC